MDILNKVQNYFSGKSDWCAPSKLYFILSISAVFVMWLQNVGNNKFYCIGSYSCNTTSVIALFIVKLVYIFAWTYILNIMCQSGLETVSWLFVLLPFILFFVFIGYFIAVNN
jgi:hypothetical protein